MQQMLKMSATLATMALGSYCQSPLARDAQAAIVGGKPAHAAYHGISVAIFQTLDGQPKHVCGGTLINETQVLTAGHCVVARDPGGHVLSPFTPGQISEFAVLIGSPELSPASQLQPISAISLHPKFSGHLDYDAALLTLAAPGQSEESKTAINLQLDKKGQKSLVKAGKSFDIVGWGNTEKINFRSSQGLGLPSASGGSDALLSVRLKVMSNATCEKTYDARLLELDPDREPQQWVSQSKFCMEPTINKDSCFGDSGGGVFSRRGTSVTLVGITSSGLGCADGFPGIYTRVSMLHDWLAEVSTPTSPEMEELSLPNDDEENSVTE